MSNAKNSCQPAQNAGQSRPVIDRNRCEGKADCVRVCPYKVFEIGKINADQKKQLSLRGRLKAFAHGGKQAFVINGDACRACQLCVQSCPEQAIKLL